MNPISKKRILRYSTLLGAILVVVIALPMAFTVTVRYQQLAPASPSSPALFPVSVDPKTKSITENTTIDSYFNAQSSPLEASVIGAGSALLNIVKYAAIAISNIPLYQDLADVSGVGGHFVTITPGMRKEQVADAFGKQLAWTSAEKKAFLATSTDSTLPLSEGSFFPATYFVNDDMSPSQVQDLVNTQFVNNVLVHYGTTTNDIVPLDEALTIASIIQRETIDNNDARLIAGVIWNRLFNGMNLQVDSTLQYAKANLAATTVWWPPVVPKDKYIKSPYNTYINSGLPPTPIANPSVTAILAALNPVKTTCLYYFNDKQGNFHCSDTYAEHTALLKKYYGTAD